jgi:hypothetical protein
LVLTLKISTPLRLCVKERAFFSRANVGLTEKTNAKTQRRQDAKKNQVILKDSHSDQIIKQHHLVLTLKISAPLRLCVKESAFFSRANGL